MRKLWSSDLSAHFPDGSVVKNPPTVKETRVQYLGWEDPLEEEMVTHASILAWEILWTEEPSRLQSVGSREPDTTKIRVEINKMKNNSENR